jgi:hypothetical protein
MGIGREMDGSLKELVETFSKTSCIGKVLRFLSSLTRNLSLDFWVPIFHSKHVLSKLKGQP